MRCRTYISVETQFENVGDALIVRELIGLIAARSEVVLDVSRCPPSFRSALALQRHPRGKMRTYGFVGLVAAMLWARLTGNVTFCFLMPGGLIGDKAPRHFIAGMLKNAMLSVVASAGVRICQVGVSYERIGPRYRRILQWRTRMMHSVMVRDEISLAYARTLGISVNGILPDLAFNLFGSRRPATGARGALAFSFRVDKDPSVRAAVERFVIELCTQAPGETVFYFVTQVGRDRAFMLHLKSIAEATGVRRCEYREEISDIDACRAIYAECEALFSNRLHGLLLALSAGAVPVAAIDPNLDAKIVGVFEQAGLSGQIVPLSAAGAGRQIKWAPSPIDFDGTRYSAWLSRYFDSLYMDSPARSRIPA